jgi:hypothetical protein
VEVLEAPAAPTLTLSAETVCAGNSITFTATGGSGTYEWSCSSFTCSGDGASMPTPTVPGSYSAQVRSVTSVAGHSCSSDSSPLVTAFIRSRGSSGQTPDVVCGCEPNLCNANVVCLAHDDDCALCTAMCRVYTAGGTPLYQVYRSGDPAQCRCVTTQSTVYGGTPYHQLYVLNGSCSAITLIGETTTYIAYEAANSARCW